MGVLGMQKPWVKCGCACLGRRQQKRRCHCWQMYLFLQAVPVQPPVTRWDNDIESIKVQMWQGACQQFDVLKPSMLSISLLARTCKAAALWAMQATSKVGRDAHHLAAGALGGLELGAAGG